MLVNPHFKKKMPTLFFLSFPLLIHELHNENKKTISQIFYFYYHFTRVNGGNGGSFIP